MRAVMRVALLPAVLIGLVAAAAPAQDKRPLTFVEFLEIPSLSDPQLSPDGRQVLFVMEKADWTANRRIGHIYRIDADGSDQVQLTFGERGESSPRWSPDGRSIAFLARRPGDEHNQLYLLAADGGEARRLTSHGTAPEHPAWSPDGGSIFFVAAEVKSPEEKERERLQDDVYSFEETDFEQEHLWRTDLDGKTSRVTEGDFSVRSFRLSPDGRRVTMMRAPTPLLEHSRFAEVWVMDVTGANAMQLTGNVITEGNPSLSPDGTTVVFTAGANAQFESYYNDKIFLVPATGGPARVLLPDVPYEVNDVVWTPDGKGLFYTANLGVHTQLFRVDVASRQVTPLTKGDHTVAGWMYQPSADRHVFSRNTPSRPAEVYTLRAAGGAEPRQVTRVFDDVERQFKLGRQERITWKGQDGEEVEGLLTYPVDYEKGRRYPLIVNTHGGPASSDKFGFGNELQVYAGRGFAVLEPNYRGSTGYGDAFLRDMVGGYFRQAHLDVLAGTDAVVAMGVADPDKLIKMGWSAGGHMTNKIITVTDRFKAASSGAGAANWISMYAQSDHRAFRTPWFGGTPWQASAPIEVFWNHSPLKDVSKVKTPTLFIVGAEDVRVPMAQSVEMFRALTYNGVPTKLYVAPREGHGWRELRHRLFKLQVEMEWFEKWVNGRAYEWERAPAGAGKPSETTVEGRGERGEGVLNGGVAMWYNPS